MFTLPLHSLRVEGSKLTVRYVGLSEEFDLADTHVPFLDHKEVVAYLVACEQTGNWVEVK